MHNPKHTLDQLESDIRIDHKLKTQVRTRLTTAPSSQKPWAMVLIPTFAGAFVLTVIFSPVQWKAVYKQFISPPSFSHETQTPLNFLQEVRAAYEEKVATSSLLQNAVRHIQTTYINEYGTISLHNAWASLDGEKYFDQVTDSQGNPLSHDWLKVNGNMYTTVEQVALETYSYKEALRLEASTSTYSLQMPAGTTGLSSVTGGENIVCYDYDWMEEPARKTDAAVQEIMRLTDIGGVVNFTNTVRLLNQLQESGQLKDLGEVYDNELGLLHTYRIAYTYQNPNTGMVPSHFSQTTTETFIGEYYFDTETYQLKKYRIGHGGEEAFSTWIITTDEVILENALDINVFDPATHNLVQIPPEIVAWSNPEIPILTLEEGCYQNDPITGLPVRLSANEEVAAWEYSKQYSE